jgi:hypothetical protein
VPVDIFYGPKMASGVGEDCTNSYKHTYHVTVKGKATVGKGYLLPGKIRYDFTGFASCSELLLLCTERRD